MYQPIESLLLVLTTNKHSNIVEDLETLRIFSKVVAEHCPGELDEASVCRNAFELLFAFDEVIAGGVGHRENVSLREIQTNLEMESHEEKLANMIRKSKEMEAQVPRWVPVYLIMLPPKPNLSSKSAASRFYLGRRR